MSNSPTGQASKDLTAEQAAKGYRFVRIYWFYGMGCMWLAEVLILVFGNSAFAIVFGGVALLGSLSTPWILRKFKREYDGRVAPSSRPDIGL